MVLPATLTVGTRGLLGALRQLRGVSGSAVARGSAASPIAGGTSSGGDGGGGNAGSGGAEPDVFTASLQHKAEEELQQLIAKPGQGATPVAAAAGDKQAGGEVSFAEEASTWPCVRCNRVFPAACEASVSPQAA